MAGTSIAAFYEDTPYHKKSDQPLHTYKENRIFGSLNGI